MRNPLLLVKTDGTPATGKAVELYLWQAAAPYYSTKVGDFTEVPNLGMYYIEMESAIRGTVLIESVVLEALTGVLFDGNLGPVNIPDGSITTAKLADSAVTTAKLADGAVTPSKTTFVEDF